MGWASRQNAARRAAGQIPPSLNSGRVRLDGRPLTLGECVLARYIDRLGTVRAVAKARSKAAEKAARRARMARRSA